MKKSRWILTIAAATVVAGLAIGAAAYMGTRGAAAQSSSLPTTMVWVPADASVVGHVDLTALFSSPLRDQWDRRLDSEEGRDQLEDFREMTGLDPFTDLNHASFAVVTSENENERGSRPDAESWGFAVQGAFDSARIIDKLEVVARVETEDYEGTTIYYPTPRERAQENEDGEDHPEEPPAFAFAESDTIVIADRDYIRQMLDAGRGRSASAGPAINQSWGEGSFVNDTFWISAAPENGFGGMMPQGGEIPPIQSLALSGRLDADIALRARGLAADLDSAIKLADVVRGFVALGSLQGGQNPDIGSILGSIQIQQFENEVDVSLTVPYETLERLSQQRAESEAEQEQEQPQPQPN